MYSSAPSWSALRLVDHGLSLLGFDMKKYPLIEHVLVTDPLTETASGYCVAGRSSGFGSLNEKHVLSHPQITDSLHLGIDQEHNFSFHRGPETGWIFSHRFSHGRRRGRFERLVVHAFCLDETLLQLLGWDPFLLPAKMV